jgi:hypothetical protein
MTIEIKTEKEAATELICPLMSGQIVPVPGAPGSVVTPGQMKLAPSVVACAREKCQWWNHLGEQCTIFSIAEALFVIHGSMTLLREVLEPPTESPLVRIGDTLDQIWKIMDTNEQLHPGPSKPVRTRAYTRDGCAPPKKPSL